MSPQEGGASILGVLRNFLWVWSGQFVSSVGSAVSGFALAVWIFQQSGAVTLLSLTVTAATLPSLLALPFAGAIVDRYSRRVVMLVADSIAALATAATAVLVFSGTLRSWHVLLLVPINSAAGAFQGPAYNASVPMLVPKHALGRASGLNQLKQAVAIGLAPAIAGALLDRIGIGGVLVLDLATYLFAVATLMAVKIPRPPASAHAPRRDRSLMQDVAVAWSYLRERRGLFALIQVFMISALLVSFANVLYAPLMLSFTTPARMGLAVSTGTLGMVLGTLLVAARGLPRHKVPVILGGLFLGGLAIAGTGMWTSVSAITAFIFFTMLILPAARGADDVLWQTKLAPDVLGRVFALRSLLLLGTAPVAYLLAGPLADGVFEPLLAPDGALAGTVGRLLGVGRGRGIGLMFVLVGAGTAMVAVAAYALPRVRRLEREVPDHLDTAPRPEESRPAMGVV
jgi:MFS family permease